MIGAICESVDFIFPIPDEVVYAYIKFKKVTCDPNIPNYNFVIM